MIKINEVDLTSMREVIKLMKNISRLNQIHIKKLATVEGEITDLMHVIELNSLTVKNKRVIIDRLTALKNTRRDLKDLMEDLDAVLVLSKMDNVSVVINDMTNAVKNIEEKQEQRRNRTYVYRVLSDKEVEDLLN